MEDAWLGSVDIAINRAFSSVSFLVPTQDLAEMTQPGQPRRLRQAPAHGAGYLL